MTPDPHPQQPPRRTATGPAERADAVAGTHTDDPARVRADRRADHDDPGKDASDSKEATSRGGLWHFVKEVVVVGATALIISFLIKTFLVQAFWIPSGSMEDTLVVGDRVMVSKIQAGPLEVERGDIVVFEDPGGWMPRVVSIDRGPLINGAVSALEFVGLSPTGAGNHLIKRVIGVEGDHVVCCDEQGRITVNDEPLAESYLFPGDLSSEESFDITVPSHSFWMMGDHRSNSRDSRANDDGTGAAGSIPAENVVGQAMVLVWPLDRFEWFSRPTDVFGGVPAAEGSP